MDKLLTGDVMRVELALAEDLCRDPPTANPPSWSSSPSLSRPMQLLAGDNNMDDADDVEEEEESDGIDAAEDVISDSWWSWSSCPFLATVSSGANGGAGVSAAMDESCCNCTVLDLAGCCAEGIEKVTEPFCCD